MGLFDFLFGSKPQQQATAPQNPVQSGGLLGGGTTQGYRDYQIDAQSRGETPMSMKDWLVQQQAKAQPKK